MAAIEIRPTDLTVDVLLAESAKSCEVMPARWKLMSTLALEGEDVQHFHR